MINNRKTYMSGLMLPTVMIFLLGNFMISDVFAVNDSYDCQIAQMSEEGFQKEIKGKYKYFKEEDLMVAFRNLKGFCCNIKAVPQEDCDNVPDNYAESPYLYAQIVDIGFRKLDGFEDVTYPGVEIDPDAKARRKDIRERVTKAEGQMSSEMTNSYKDARKLDDTQGLANKYLNICDEAKAISDNVFRMYNPKFKPLSLVDKCKSLAQSRILKENDYFDTMKINKGKKFMVDNLKSYMKEYFFETRWNVFLEKVSVMLGEFGVVVEKIHNGVENCSGAGNDYNG